MSWLCAHKSEGKDVFRGQVIALLLLQTVGILTASRCVCSRSPVHAERERPENKLSSIPSTSIEMFKCCSLQFRRYFLVSSGFIAVLHRTHTHTHTRAMQPKTSGTKHGKSTTINYSDNGCQQKSISAGERLTYVSVTCCDCFCVSIPPLGPQR